MLITLTNGDLPAEALRRHGLRNLHLPIYDREAPTLAQMRMLALRMKRFLDRGEVLCVHCRAGVGRTGTVLAGWLIAEGLTADEAVRRIRTIDAEFVQSRSQQDFLQRFEAHLLELVPPDTANTPGD
jgi:atypical dual specificity phosphatase